jgi:hypothetical protein
MSLLFPAVPGLGNLEQSPFLLRINSEVTKLQLESRSVTVIPHRMMAVDRCTVSTRDIKGLTGVADYPYLTLEV